jgi:subtilisin-like proprotein convertase family protein
MICLLLPLPLMAQVILESQTYTPAMAIPDGSTAGISQTVTFPSTIASITEVTLDLEISGGFTGDLYAYLQYDTGFAILLNRPGRTSTSGIGSLGYLDSGMTIRLNDGAHNGDLHFYQDVLNPGGGTLTGTWQPDGRAVSPLSVVGSENRDATLASFTGLPSGGDWTLFLADLSSGGTATLESWTLRVAGTAVPEPAQVATLAGIGLLLAALWHRTRRSLKR